MDDKILEIKNLAVSFSAKGKRFSRDGISVRRRKFRPQKSEALDESVRQTWSSLVGGYIAQRASLSGLVVVMDARRPFMPTDEWLIEFMKERPNVPMHWLLNKADQLKNMERRRTLDLAWKRAAEIGPRVSVQLFSGMKREGVPELAATLEGWLGLRTPES